MAHLVDSRSQFSLVVFIYLACPVSLTPSTFQTELFVSILSNQNQGSNNTGRKRKMYGTESIVNNNRAPPSVKKAWDLKHSYYQRRSRASGHDRPQVPLTQPTTRPVGQQRHNMYQRTVPEQKAHGYRHDEHERIT
jgi:hypothetical protein